MRSLSRLVLLTTFGLAAADGFAAPAVTSFSTGGHTVYHLGPATIDHGGERVIISAASDGNIVCHTPAGQLRWKASIGEGFPFDLCVADINGDGLDETLVASSDGSLYAFGPKGERLWTFQKAPPLFQVCAARQKDGTCIVLTGGVEQVLYALSADGKLLGQLTTDACIRNVRAGDVRGEGRDQVAVTTAPSGLGLWGPLSLLLVDPTNLHILWERKNLDPETVPAADHGHRFYSLVMVDVNQDGKNDLVLSAGACTNGRILAFDGEGNHLFTKSDARIPNAPYRMNLLVPVKLPNDEFIVGQFANVLIVYNLDGSCREVVTGPYAYANRAFDPLTRTLYCGSEVSGGDEIVCVHLDQPAWQQAFAQMKPVGKLAQIIRNLETLKTQVAAFQRPAYQPEPRRVDVLLLDEYHVLSAEELRPSPAAYPNCRFVSHIVLGQKPEPGQWWCRKLSAFCPYDLTADELVAKVKQWEARGQDFLIQAAHASAPHMPLTTFQRVLEAAPRHLWGFEFSEIGQQVSAADRQFVDNIVLPLAEMCRKHGGKKILFRNKSIFWNGPCYVPYWRDVLLGGKYRDVFVPALEETNCRTQELSLAGRLGLWASGAFDHWACRAETDNACFDRMWEWSAQQVLSHNLRNLISAASQGADVFFNSVHQGPFSKELGRQLLPFYEMVDKGAIYVPQRSQLLSLSGLCLGMKGPPASPYLMHGNNLHRYTYSKDEHSPLVFDRLDAYWAAAPLAPWDFSRYAFGVTRRMCNFLPLTPYGMVTIVSDQTPTGGNNRFQQMIVTDGQYFYDDKDQRHSPAEYREKVQASLQQAAAKLPLLVRGPAHWSAARLDATHVRVTLVDPGYLDPDDRDVEIVLQQPVFTGCRDILSGENLPLHDHCIQVHIPMGSLRIVDLNQEDARK